MHKPVRPSKGEEISESKEAISEEIDERYCSKIRIELAQCQTYISTEQGHPEDPSSAPSSTETRKTLLVIMSSTEERVVR